MDHVDHDTTLPLTSGRVVKTSEFSYTSFGISYMLVPSESQDKAIYDSEGVEFDNWSREDRIELAEIMIQRWQQFIERERRS